jgi:hypothetical protein
MADPDTNSVDPQSKSGTQPEESPPNPNLVSQVPPPVTPKTERTYTTDVPEQKKYQKAKKPIQPKPKAE